MYFIYYFCCCCYSILSSFSIPCSFFHRNLSHACSGKAILHSSARHIALLSIYHLPFYLNPSTSLSLPFTFPTFNICSRPSPPSGPPISRPFRRPCVFTSLTLVFCIHSPLYYLSTLVLLASFSPLTGKLLYIEALDSLLHISSPAPSFLPFVLIPFFPAAVPYLRCSLFHLSLPFISLSFSPLFLFPSIHISLFFFFFCLSFIHLVTFSPSTFLYSFHRLSLPSLPPLIPFSLPPSL